MIINYRAGKRPRRTRRRAPMNLEVVAERAKSERTRGERVSHESRRRPRVVTWPHEFRAAAAAVSRNHAL